MHWSWQLYRVPSRPLSIIDQLHSVRRRHLLRRHGAVVRRYWIVLYAPQHLDWL
eukprot:COSAG02_NODE_57637_length_280_cov_0.569061_1_plen_53_part_01